MLIKGFLVPVALAMLSTARPSYSGALNNDRSISIPLTRRIPANGRNFIDVDTLILHKVRMENKYKRSVIEHEFTNLPEIPHIRSKCNQTRSVGTGALPLQDEFDMVWAGDIQIGTPGQSFSVTITTGSPYLWVPSTSCNSMACSSMKNTYNGTSSSTSQSVLSGNSTEHLLYNDGKSVNGTLVSDAVTMGGVEATMSFIAADHISNNDGSFHTNGILGLGIPSRGDENTNFIMTAYNNSAIQRQAFGIKLAQNDSELYIGGFNASLYDTNTLEQHPVVLSDNPSGGSYWQIANGTVKINNKTVSNNLTTIIDSGTTYILGPQAVVKEIYAKMNATSVTIDGEETGIYTFPCNNTPTVSFQWDSMSQWEISKDNFKTQMDMQGAVCFGAILGHNETTTDLGSNVWIVGDSFMKNVYTGFSWTTDEVPAPQIAFAALTK